MLLVNYQLFKAAIENDNNVLSILDKYMSKHLNKNIEFDSMYFKFIFDMCVEGILDIKYLVGDTTKLVSTVLNKFKNAKCVKNTTLRKGFNSISFKPKSNVIKITFNGSDVSDKRLFVSR